MKNKLVVIGLTSVISLSSGMSFAADDTRSCGYVWDSYGNVVRDNYGDCVRSVYWKPEVAIKECDPDLFKEKKMSIPPAPKPVPVKSVPQPVYEKIELKAAALFDTNESVIKPTGKAELDELANKLRDFENVEKIQLLGHTDSRGKKSYNRDLSQNRANSVKSYLVGKGVDANIIEAIGVGEDAPAADNGTAEGRAQNRRVEVGIKATHRVK